MFKGLNRNYIFSDALKTSGTIALIGAGVGIVSAFIKEKRRVDNLRSLRLKLPEFVRLDSELSEHLMTLANSKLADLNILERAARRIDSLLELQDKIAKASPSTVSGALSATAHQLQNSSLKYLQEFYDVSGVATIVEEGRRKPVDKIKCTAHDYIFETIDTTRHNIQLLIDDKYFDGVAERTEKVMNGLND
jgi:hypothetical protein